MEKDFFMNMIKEAILIRIDELNQAGVSEQEIEKRIQTVDLSSILPELICTASSDKLDYLVSKISEISAERKASAAEFIEHQESIWGECFEVSDAMYILATEAGEIYGKYVKESIPADEREQKQYTYWALHNIHGRVCQVFLEILYLMKLGFADGAYARWRSMYELCCTGMFISQHGEQIAKQFYEKSDTDEQNYRWTAGAKDHSGKELHITNSKKLREACGMPEEWEAQYRLACFVNHASPQGTFNRMGKISADNVIPVGHSDYGIAAPAEHSAIFLAWTTSLFLNLFPYPEGIEMCKVLNSWVNIVRKSYSSKSYKFFERPETET